MSKFTKQMEALEATRCETCNGIGIKDIGDTEGQVINIKCPDCDDGIAIDPFEKYWGMEQRTDNSLAIKVTKLDAEEIFNAGRESK